VAHLTTNNNNLKNKTYLFLFLVLASSLFLANSANAQMDKVPNLPGFDRARFHFGFILAGNQMNFTLKPKADFGRLMYTNAQAPGLNYDSLSILSISSSPTPGFTIGIVSNMALGKYFDIRFIPALAFGERKVNYSLLAYRNGKPVILDIIKPITSTYIELPLMIRYKSKRLNNVRGYILSGIKYNIDLASNKKSKEEDENGNPTYLKLFDHDILLEFGAGFDFYTQFFKFGVEVKMGYGVRDLLIREQTIFTDGIQRLNSKVFTISLTFEG
jgi:Outer membrane protein beta-barrel domain